MSCAFFEVGYRTDPWLAAAPEVPLFQGLALDRIVPPARFVASPVYNDVLRGRSDILHCMVLAVRSEDHLHAIALQRDRSTGRFIDEDENALTALAEPLSQLSVSHRRRTLGLARTLSDAALESSPGTGERMFENMG